MRKIFVCLVVLSCSLSASGTTHNLFVKDPMFLERQEAYLHNNHRLEVHVGPVVSFGNIKDKKDHSASHQMYGLLGRVDLRIWKGLWIGIEGEKFKTVNLKNTILPELSRKSWSGLIKLNITNNTQPYLYLIGGVGEFWEESEQSNRPITYNQHGIMYVGGIGGEVKIWKGLYLTGEGKLTYEPHPWKNFLLRSPHIREELKVGLSVFF